MRKKSKPFKIDLGFGNMFQTENIMPKKQRSDTLPTFSGEKYAVLTNRDGVIIKHTFKKSINARAFREKAHASGSYNAVSDIQLDW